MRGERAGIALGVLGVGVTLLTTFLAMADVSVPAHVVWAMGVVGVVFVLVGLYTLLFPARRRRRDGAEPAEAIIEEFLAWLRVKGAAIPEWPSPGRRFMSTESPEMQHYKRVGGDIEREARVEYQERFRGRVPRYSARDASKPMTLAPSRTLKRWPIC